MTVKNTRASRFLKKSMRKSKYISRPVGDLWTRADFIEASKPIKIQASVTVVG